MKSLIALITILAGTVASAQNIGIMKQSYLLCSPDDNTSAYNLILENAAVGEATAIKLIQYQNTGWKSVANRKITNTKPLNMVSLPRHFSKQYSGSGFVATRVVRKNPAMNMWTDEVELKIVLQGRNVKINFHCSTVE